MTSIIRTAILIAFFFFQVSIGKSQDAPVGYWESLLPYNTAIGVCTDGNKVYVATKQYFFTCNSLTSGFEKFSKLEGMSDVGMQRIAYDPSTSSAILVYANGNIDIFSNNTFYNIPDLKLKNTPVYKAVNDVYIENGRAYLSTTIGLLVIDMAARSVYDSHLFISPSGEIIPVSSYGTLGNYQYAATIHGIYRASKSNFDNWQLISTADSLSQIVRVKDQLFFSAAYSIFIEAADTLIPVFHSGAYLQYIDGEDNDLIIGVSAKSGGAVKIMNLQYHVTDSFDCSDSTCQAVRTLDGSIWVAAPNTGLRKRTEANHTDVLIPEGPNVQGSYDIYAYNRNVYIAHGGYTDNFAKNGTFYGVSYYHNGEWTLYKRPQYSCMQNEADISCVVKDESRGVVYAGSYLDGLVAITDTSCQVTGNGSILDGSVAYGPGNQQVVGLALDKQDNLWLTEMFAPNHQLYVKTAAGDWYKFHVAGASFAGPLALDDLGQVWIVGYSGGMSVFTANGTISDTSDDISRQLLAGKGLGNLPTNTIYCVTKDRNNEMWIGTATGLCVISGCAAPFTSPMCEATIPEIKSGPYAGYPFASENVRTIAVDAINNKWVGTDNGAWYLSADGTEVLGRYTAANSPMPSDHVSKITIDKMTGDVYIGTDQGLVSYHGKFSDAAATLDSVTVFPNPVPPGYGGSVVITGLMNNADVRITDISGQLVYRAKANGGQLIWNGADYTGHRPQSGVYMIFAVGGSGSRPYTGKIVILQ